MWTPRAGSVARYLLDGVHTAKILRLSQDLPIVIEIVDAPEKIEGFLPDLDAMVTEGLVTVERAQVILYREPKEPRT